MALESLYSMKFRVFRLFSTDAVSELIFKCAETGSNDFKLGFIDFLNQYSLVHLPNYKIVLTNLFILIKRNSVLESPFIDYLLNFMVVLDSEVSSAKRAVIARKKLDFCFRLFFAFVNQKLKAGEKFHKNKDLFINYMLKCELNDKNDYLFESEKIFNQIFDLFFNKIINLEKPGLVQYLILFAVSSDIKPTMNPDFDNLKQLFMHKNVLLLFDTKIASKVKENVLYYMLSFLQAVKINQKNLYSVMYYSIQLLSKLTKRITKKLIKEFPDVKCHANFSILKERTKTDYLNHFNKGLFCKLLAFLTRSLSLFNEELKTQHMIDLINLFEKYFVRYQTQLEIFVNGNQEFYNICCKLNKVIKDPKLCELIDQSSFTVRREKNLSGLSNNAEYYIMNSPIQNKVISDKFIKPQTFNFTHSVYNSSINHNNKLMLVNQLSENSDESPKSKKQNCNQAKFLSPSRRSLYTSTISFHSKVSITEQKRMEANLWDFELQLDPFKYTDAFFYQEFLAGFACYRNSGLDNKFSMQDTDHSLMFTPVLGKRNDMEVGRSVEF